METTLHDLKLSNYKNVVTELKNGLFRFASDNSLACKTQALILSKMQSVL